MKELDILEILNDWNLWNRELDCGLPRSLYIRKIEKNMKSSMVIAITGVRRSGKSYIMRQLLKRNAERHGANSTLFVNLEDSRWKDYTIDVLMEIYEAYEKNLKPKAKPFVFLDEIQKVKGWERFVRTLHELNKAHVIISGSSKSIMSKDIATVLTGRYINILTFPLSFGEFLEFRNIAVRSKADIAFKKREIEASIDDYLDYGGFPLVVLNENKREILINYFESIIQSDIIERHNVRKSDKLRQLAKFYFSNPASPITFQSIRRFLKISTNTAEKFSGWMEDACILFFIKRFSFSVKEQENSPRKVYAIDNGLVSTVGFRTSMNRGRMIENAAAVNLKRMQSESPSIEIYYWKDYFGHEVDFVVTEGHSIRQLIQVCYNLDDMATKDRELRSLLKASKQLRCDNLLVITGGHEGEENHKGKIIKFVPLWRWLLHSD